MRQCAATTSRGRIPTGQCSRPIRSNTARRQRIPGRRRQRRRTSSILTPLRDGRRPSCQSQARRRTQPRTHQRCVATLLSGLTKTEGSLRSIPCHMERCRRTAARRRRRNRRRSTTTPFPGGRQPSQRWAARRHTGPRSVRRCGSILCVGWTRTARYCSSTALSTALRRRMVAQRRRRNRRRNTSIRSADGLRLSRP